MTVANLWNLCGNWTPFSKVHVYFIGTGFTADYIYVEDVLDDYANRIVASFTYDTQTDTMNINIA